MPTNQLPFSEDSHQQGSTMPKKVKFTNQLFPPRINSELGAGQFDQSPANNPPPFSNFNPEMSTNTPVNNQPLFQNNPSQFSGFNTGIPNVDVPQGTQPLPQNNPPQFDGHQMGNGSRGTITGQLGNPGTGALTQSVGQYSGDTGMLTLNQAVKVVKIPIAGKPGEFKTGILPILPPTQTGALPPPSSNPIFTNTPKRNNKIILLIVLVFLILLGSGGYYLLHTANSTPSITTNPAGTANNDSNKGQKNNSVATAAVNATATAADASLIVSESLAYADRDWSRGEQSNINFAFEGGAYHIRQDGKYFGYALIPGIEAPNSYTYNLTMQNIHYDQDNTSNLSFYGMVFNYKSYNNRSNSTFYVFRVNNGTNATYEFDKYDDRNLAVGEIPWKQLFPSKDNDAGTNGKGTYHEFKGRSQQNAYSVSDNNGTFTFSVNGTKIGTVKDSSFSGGGLGMGVSQTKSEAAFSNLSILRN